MRFLYYEIVSVVDADIYHAVSVHRQYEICTRADESRRYRHLIHDVLLCENRLACRNSADYRQGYGIERDRCCFLVFIIHRKHRSRLGRVLLYKTFILQRLNIAVNGRSRLYPERCAYLPYRR